MKLRKLKFFNTPWWVLTSMLLCAGIQMLSWEQTQKHLPKLGILSEPPNASAVKVYSLGDQVFYFRYLALDLQNSGDSFGRFTALKDYNYKTLEQWLFLINSLDPKSQYLATIASYYYSNTQRTEDLKYVINFLEHYFEQDRIKNWWWMSQATMLAFHRLQDKNLSMKLAKKLSETHNPNMPRWAQQMYAIISAGYGERELAYAIIQDLTEKYDDYTQAEINFMNYFIQDRLGYLKGQIRKRPKKLDVMNKW